jgi:hypothetical protein
MHDKRRTCSLRLEDEKKAVGIELLLNFIKSRVFTVLPTAIQMNWSQMELSWAEFHQLNYTSTLTTSPGRMDSMQSEGSRQEPLQVG